MKFIRIYDVEKPTSNTYEIGNARTVNPLATLDFLSDPQVHRVQMDPICRPLDIEVT